MLKFIFRNICYELKGYLQYKYVGHEDGRIIIIIIIIIIINCNWVVTRWQWLFYMYTEYEIDYY